MSIERIKKLNKAIIALNDETVSKASLYKIIEMITDELSKEQFTEEVMQNIVESVMGQVRVPEDGKDYILSDEDLQFIISEVSELIDDGTDYIISEQDIEDITQRVSKLVKDGKDGKDGNDYIITSDDYKNIAELVEVEIPEYEIPEQPTPDDIRDMLETLQGDDRLDILAIKGFDEILRKLKNHSGNVTIGNRGIQDAPKDSTTYARNNGEWVEVSGGVEQYADLDSFPDTGEEDILYIAQDDNLAYRWNSTEYVSVGGGGSSLIRDTRANIMSLTPDDGTEAISTDFRKKMIYLSGQWYESSAILDERAGSVDAGVVQDSNLSGYGRDYITDKHIANSTLGEFNGEKENAIRITTIDGTKFIQAYMDGEWKTVLSGINIEVDDVEPDVEVTDFAPYRISLITGDSDVKDMNGTPVIQNMKTDAGAIQSKLVINGGTF